ncbi:MAG: 4Fe-4S dicluster domain-containing protein [Myxococcota bacterium]
MSEEESESLSRRAFFGAGVAGTVAAAGALVGRGRSRSGHQHLRPPGALAEGAFEDACLRCFKCGSACPNDCIDFFGLRDGLDKAFTPYVRARERGCTLCGDCADVCPSGALKPFEATRDGWKADVKMGEARLNEGLCYSYAGRTCGACYRACPLAGEAITIGVFEQPTVHPEACVGCGLCEQACLHLPQAIRVIPAARLGDHRRRRA